MFLSYSKVLGCVSKSRQMPHASTACSLQSPMTMMCPGRSVPFPMGLTLGRVVSMPCPGSRPALKYSRWREELSQMHTGREIKYAQFILFQKTWVLFFVHFSLSFHGQLSHHQFSKGFHFNLTNINFIRGRRVWNICKINCSVLSHSFL